MTDQTPSPQSVVVPVELAETPAIRNTLGLLRSALLCGEQWSDTCRDAYLAALKELDQLAMLAAAPAPSSLAGGAFDHIHRLADEFNPAMHDIDQVLSEINQIALAALSPEAPAEDDDGPCTCCDATGITIQTERPCACAAGIPFKAPAEGAGEIASAARALLDACYKADENSDLSDFVDGMLLTRLDKALRARSSAPEAREGEAPFGYWVEHKAGNSPMFIPYGSFIPASDNYKITKLYTHPAAPSADKLRIAVEALEKIKTGRATVTECSLIARRALAALKAEGC